MKNRRGKQARRRRLGQPHDRIYAEDRAHQQALAAEQERTRTLAERRSQLRAAMTSYLDMSGIALDVEDGSEAIAFVRGKDKVAYLFTDEAVAHMGAHRIKGEFLKSGDHWDRLHSFLLDLQGGGATADSPPLPLTRATLPGWLTDEAVAAAMQASFRIRTQRKRAYSRPVLLDGGSYQLRFEPIRAGSTGAELPFSFHAAERGPTLAVLQLQTPADPLAVAFDELSDEISVVGAWVLALLGFTDLTCVERETTQSSFRVAASKREKARITTGALVGPVGGSEVARWVSSKPRRGDQSRRSTFAKSLEPVGATAEYAASFVAGHRRQLRPGEHCSDDARAAARANGIELAADETWVKPYERGLPRDFVLQYRWTASLSLAT
jgi:hypothetical protein